MSPPGPTVLAFIFIRACCLLSAAQSAPRDPTKLTAELCAGCHGTNLTGGTAQSLVDSVWKTGSDDKSILRAIRDGFPQTGMAPFGSVLSEAELQELLGHIRKLNRQFALGLLATPQPAPASVTLQSEQQAFRLETVAEPLDTPWSIVFLPDKRMLISDRIGALRVISADGALVSAAIRDTPKPYVKQDGGFLDLIAHPNYATNGWIYLAYTEQAKSSNASMTVVVRGRIREGAWVDQQDLFRAPERYYYNDTSHYGCRFLFDRDGHLFFTIGDRGTATDAQDLASPCGKIHRIHDDGRIPRDNPFVANPTAWPSVWTYGHRHVQGLQFHPATGDLWATEHGPRGGDELNRITRGHNYGWPTISNGEPQRSEKIEGTTRPGLESPVTFWTPSIAPAAIEFYTGDRFPRWKGQLFVASLVGRHLRRIELRDNRVVHQEVLFHELGRVRDVVTGPDGLLYVALNNPGRIARLVPVE